MKVFENKVELLGSWFEIAQAWIAKLLDDFSKGIRTGLLD